MCILVKRYEHTMIIATKTSVYLLDVDETEPNLLLEGVEVRRVAEGDQFNVVASADGSVRIVNSDGIRQLKTGIKDRIDSLCITNEKPFDLLIGTTPPHHYRMKGEGPAKKIIPFDNLKVRNNWYTPWGGPAAVRSLAKTGDGWVYADIHVGSVMRSPDYGKTWEPVTPTLHEDVHEVNTTPASNRRVYANTYLSVYVSDDRGYTWKHRSKNLHDRSRSFLKSRP